MSNYKVPQDVEADDKILGPFNFRQFIYLGIVAACIGLSIPLFRLAWPLGFLLSPVIILFAVLALPLKKDQPMETYLAAIIQFILKPNLRLWDQEIEEATLVIDASKNEGVARTKNLSQEEAKQRLNYLSALVDSPTGGTVFNDEFYAEAVYATDILEPGATYIKLDSQLAHADREQKELAIAKMRRFLDGGVKPAQPAITHEKHVSRNESQTGLTDRYQSDLPISVIEARLNQKQGGTEGNGQ